MTREEIERFVDETICDGWDRIEMVKAITDRWEEDVQENRDASYQEGIHIGQESV